MDVIVANRHDELSEDVYTFHVFADYGSESSLRLKLASYRQATRESKRHGWKVFQWWDTHNTRDCTMKSAPEVPAVMQVQAVKALVDKIKFEFEERTQPTAAQH